MGAVAACAVLAAGIFLALRTGQVTTPEQPTATEGSSPKVARPAPDLARPIAAPAPAGRQQSPFPVLATSRPLPMSTLAQMKVDSSGGTLTVMDTKATGGPAVSVTIPPATFDEPTVVRAARPAEPLVPPHGLELMAPAFVLEPEDVTFKQPVIIALSPDHSPDPESEVFLATWRPHLQKWQLWPATWEPEQQRFVAEVRHFSIWSWVKGALGIHDRFRKPEEEEFCISCHEMEPILHHLEQGGHKDVSCAQCHYGTGARGFMTAKLDGLRHVAVHTKNWVFGDEVEDLHMTPRMYKDTNFRCRECHEPEFTRDAKHLPTIATVSFEARTGTGTRNRDHGPWDTIACTTCHEVVAPLRDLVMAPEVVYEQAGDCLSCHRQATPIIVKDWTGHAHARAGVSCADCHGLDHAALNRARAADQPLVADATCAACHDDYAQAAMDMTHRRADTLVAARERRNDPRVSAASANVSGEVSSDAGGEAGREARAPTPGIVDALVGSTNGNAEASAAGTGTNDLSREKRRELGKQVKRIIIGKCASCHPSVRGGRAAMFNVGTRQSGLPWVTPGDPSRSYMVRKVEGSQRQVGGSGGRMPPGASPLSAEDLALIRRWILVPRD